MFCWSKIVLGYEEEKYLEFKFGRDMDEKKFIHDFPFINGSQQYRNNFAKKEFFILMLYLLLQYIFFIREGVKKDSCGHASKLVWGGGGVTHCN